MKILGCPMNPDTNDAGASTVREYFTELVKMVWGEGEGFSGKRPFGNSGWEHEVYSALVVGKAAPGTVHRENDEIVEVDYETLPLRALIDGALEHL